MTRTFKYLALSATLLASMISTGCATAPSRAYSAPQIYYVDAKVLQQNPTPERCGYEQQGGNSSAGTVTGVIFGGLLGRQFGGSKKARNVGTAIGAILGGSVGSGVDRRSADPRNTPKLACKSDGWMVTVGYIHPVTSVYQVTTLPMERRTRAEYISVPVR